MTRQRAHLLILACLLLAAGACTASNPSPEEEPTPSPEPAEPFKARLIQLPDRLMWINSDLTEAEFDALSPGPGWNKMTLGEPQADEDWFDHSPDNQTDGEFTEQEMHGLTWAYIARVVEFRTPIDEVAPLFLNRVDQYRHLRYVADRSVWLLENSEGVQYIRINRDPNRSSDSPVLPDGWTLNEVVLAEERVVDALGESEVLVDSIDDRYLGPLDPLLEF